MAKTGWGGKRANAGRKPKGDHAMVSRTARPRVDGKTPLLVTMRLLPHARNLRTKRNLGVLRTALARSSDRFGYRPCDVALLDDMLLLLIEADDNHALARGMQGTAIRIAKTLNGLMGRHGAVFADRYALQLLRTPAEVQVAMRAFAEDDLGDQLESDDFQLAAGASRLLKAAQRKPSR